MAGSGLKAMVQVEVVQRMVTIGQSVLEGLGLLLRIFIDIRLRNRP